MKFRTYKTFDEDKTYLPPTLSPSQTLQDKRPPQKRQNKYHWLTDTASATLYWS